MAESRARAERRYSQRMNSNKNISVTEQTPSDDVAATSAKPSSTFDDTSASFDSIEDDDDELEDHDDEKENEDDGQKIENIDKLGEDGRKILSSNCGFFY